MTHTPVFQWLAYSVATYTFDAIDTVVGWCFPTPAPLVSSSDIDHLSDNELINLRRTKPHFAPTHEAIGTHNIVRVTEKTVLKGAQDPEDDVVYPSEALILELVSQHTTIPVPRVRRILKSKWTTFIAMEYISGRQLSSVWPTLSLFGRIRIAFTVRRYIRQLRSIPHPHPSCFPGPLGTANDGPKRCENPPIFGPIITSRGPFTSYGELVAFFNDRLVIALESGGVDPSPCWGTFDASEPLVLCHQDLNMRNFIVGDDGRLWLVDWAWAGFYPRWFEFVAMKKQAENEESVMDRKEPFWDALIPFICDPCFRQEAWLDHMSIAFNWL